MTSLPSSPFTLHGGCFCSAIRYTISVPELSLRPAIPNAPKFPIGPQTEVTKFLPIITLDHCNSCRGISGAILESWFICPQSWVQFELQPRIENSTAREVVNTEHISSNTIKPSTAEVLRPTKKLINQTNLCYFASSENVHRTFCGNCGTHLTFHYSGDDDDMAREENWGPHFDIAVGTMEKDSLEMEGFRPGRQSWYNDGIGWVQKMFGL